MEKKTHLKFNQREESTNYLPFSISYFSPTVLTTHSPEFTGLKLEIISLINLLFHFCLIRNNNSESRSWQKFWIRIRNTYLNGMRRSWKLSFVSSKLTGLKFCPAVECLSTSWDIFSFSMRA